MAEIDKLIPHLIKWETGVRQLYGESLEHLFERSRRAGYANDPDDKGGATQSGVTLNTYIRFRKFAGRSKPTLKDLKNITFTEWKELRVAFFWDKIHGGAIKSESVAVMICDWYWTSGAWGLKNTQKVLGVVQDGIVGVKTLGAINKWSRGAEDLWEAIRAERIRYYKRIAIGKQKKFLRGWLNRVNDLKFDDKE